MKTIYNWGIFDKRRKAFITLGYSKALPYNDPASKIAIGFTYENQADKFIATRLKDPHNKRFVARRFSLKGREGVTTNEVKK